MTMKKLLLLCTILAAAPCSPKTFSIVQIADAQLGFDAAVKGSVPGAEYVNDLTFEIECLKATVAKVNELKPDMVVFTGDQVHLPYDKEQWDAFVQGIADIDPSIEQYHLPGNHDHILKDGTADPQDFIARFGSDRFAVRKNNVNVVAITMDVLVNTKIANVTMKIAVAAMTIVDVLKKKNMKFSWRLSVKKIHGPVHVSVIWIFPVIPLLSW